MTRSAVASRLAAATAGIAIAAALFTSAAMAQTATARKPPPRLPPSPSEQARIPAGVDTGSPATSDTMPLGTPIPPAVSADQDGLRTRGSAAARAAARRPAPASSSSGATIRTSGADKTGCPSAKVADDGRPGGEPVAIPGSGFVGQSASPTTAAKVATRPTGRVAC